MAFAVYAWVYVANGRASAVQAGSLMFWAVMFRVMGLWGEPLFEDDFYRYLWDGYRFAIDGTPYGIPPEAYFTDPSVPPAFRSILSQINLSAAAEKLGPAAR